MLSFGPCASCENEELIHDGRGCTLLFRDVKTLDELLFNECVSVRVCLWLNCNGFGFLYRDKRVNWRLGWN